MLWTTDSAKKSDNVDPKDVVDLDFNDGRADRTELVDGETLHSGRIMMAVTASKT